MERQKVISQNLRPLSHPYYYAYRDLQRLCMRILRHEEMKYGSDDNQIHGILFDGAWLWEEYLNTFLKDLLTHPRNKTKEGGLNIFTDGTGECYPDFYNQEHGIVLDAKYKRYDGWANIQNKDLFQVISYMHIINGTKGGFLVPTKKKELSTKTISGEANHKMSVFGMPVDFASPTFKDYCEYIEHQETELYKQIKDYFIQT